MFAWLVINYGMKEPNNSIAQVSVHVSSLSGYLKDVEEMKKHITTRSTRTENTSVLN